MKRKVMTVLLSLMLVLTMLPAAAYAQADIEPAIDAKAISKIAKQLQDPSNDPFDFVEGTAETTDPIASLPSYDMREHGYVTPVKFQNPFGTCWGFSAIAAAESSILGSGLAAKDGYDEKTLNLSEKHLVYFVSKSISDTKHPQYGEGNHARKGLSLADQLNGGGTPFFATSLFASGIGPVIEDADPILQYKGANGWVEKRKVNGKIVDFCYDEEDDWSLKESMRFKQSYVLKNSYMLPSPAGIDEDTYEYTYNPNGTAAIKEMIANNRAVQIGFCADTSMPTQEVHEGQYISTNWAHYTYDSGAQPNHAVTIVGWDDNYSRTNFVKGHRPPKNGAWLVKNSWGSEEESFPNKGPGWGLVNEEGLHTGYFWLSYYDPTISMPEALEFEKSTADNDYTIDQHDFMPVNDISGGAADEVIRMSNVFKAERCEDLEQVSCETTYPGTSVVSKIYLLPNDFKYPTEGYLAATVKGTYEYGGFHKMTLKNPVRIQKGQYYAIVQTLTTPEGQYSINMPLTYSKEFIELWGEKADTWTEGVINPKESFIYIKDRWYDYSSDKVKEEFFGAMHPFFSFDNFPIKGYCSPASNISIRVNGNQEMSLYEGYNTIKLSVSYKGSASEDFDAPDVTWKLSTNGKKYYTMTPDPDNPYVCSITAKDVGRGLVYVTAKGVGTTVVPLSVAKKQLFSVTIYDTDKLIYTGKAVKPKIEVEDEFGDIIPSSHYTVTYKNNVKCGDATAYIKIKSTDPTYTGSTDTTFTILPQRAVINSLAAGKGKLTIKVKSQKKSGASRYKVYYKIKGNTKWKTKTFKVANGNKLVIKNLKKGKRYVVKVETLVKSKYWDGYVEGKMSKTKTSKKIQ